MLGDEWIDLNQHELYMQYDSWLHKITDMDYWSEENPDGQRIYWESFWKASRAKSKRTEFDQPGCYLWGWGSGYCKAVPRYIGETGARKNLKLKPCLRKRMRGRYLSGNVSQCRLAADYGDVLIEKGWKGLPDSILVTHFKGHGGALRKRLMAEEEEGQSADEHVRAEYIRDHGKPTARLRDASDFAKHGISEIWFALIPTMDKERIGELEGKLIKVAQEWNSLKGYSQILNDRS